MTKAMKMLEDLRKSASYIDVYLGDVIDRLKKENASIERVVRDAILGYQDMFATAPNDETERELVERAEKANNWLVEHDFKIEDLTWTKEEVPCL